MSDPSAAKPNPTWDPTARPDAAVTERGFFAELLVFAWQNKLWWIVPSLTILLGLGVLVFVAGQDRFAPFFYSLF
jgi:hypothetical protein